MAAPLPDIDSQYPELPTGRSGIDAHALSVELVDSNDQFQALQEAWSKVFAADLESGFFLSWGWVSALFDAYASRVRVLAVRQPGGDYVGFYPISTRMRWSRSQQRFQTVLEPAGRAALSELTGILCAPKHERQVIAALADKITAMRWTRFSMRYEPTGRRSQMLLDALPQAQFNGRFRSYTINDGSIDNLNSLHVTLPNSHDEWLASLSSNTRQKIRRYSRKHLESGAWHVTQTDTDTLTRHIDIVLDLWTRRWVAEKGKSGARRTTSIYRHMFETAHQLGMLHLPILWLDGTPLAAHACIADTSRGHVHFVAAGRSVENDQPNSGLLLHSESIRWAIEAGFAIYDFGHGDEAYKASLGGHTNRLHYLYVERRSQNPYDAIDPFNMASGIRKLRSLIEADKARDARRACKQLQEIAEAHQLPDDPITKLSARLEA